MKMQGTFIFVLLLVVMGCASLPPPKTVSLTEKIRQDGSMGMQLAEKLDPLIKFKSDIEINVFLRKTAAKLSATSEALKDSPVGVFTIVDKDKTWRNFAIPGNRLYISIGLLKKLEFENELAATLALQLAHILKRHAIQNFQAHPNEDIVFFGPSGIFTFHEDDYLLAIETAVSLMYNAGYDPRGMISVWNIYKQNINQSPFTAAALEIMLDKTRESNADFSPLRNPVVRSLSLNNIKTRINNL